MKPELNLCDISILDTGGANDDFIFRHIILTEEQYAHYNMEDTDEILERLDIDFISVLMSGTFDFFHVAYADQKAYIEKNGLTITKSEWVQDLGNGVYVIPQKSIRALENLMDYIIDKYIDEEKILVIKGTYTGAFLRCIAGDGHEEYRVCLQDIKTDDIESISVQDADDISFL